MTDASMDAVGTLSKALVEDHRDELRDILAAALHRVMEAEVTALCGAEYGERSPGRADQRNGYRERPLDSRLGRIDLEIPKLRHGGYLPSFLEARSRVERAFVSVITEAYVLGVSTRRVDALVKALGAHGLSKSEVSRMCQELDAQVACFRSRRLEKAFPYVFLDGLYVKVRDGGRVVSKAVLVAYGVSEAGEREVLGAEVAPGEMEDAWRGFLESLVERGLRGVKLAISDDHKGLRKAIRGVLNGTSWQRCTVHFLRNVLSRVPRKAQGMVAFLLRSVFNQATPEGAREAMTKAIAVLEKQHPEAAKVVREGEDDVLTFMTFPQAHWRQIRSTNPLERLNREIRRRTDVVGIFPNDAAALRLIGMVLSEQNDEWAVGRRYFSLESMKLLEEPGVRAIEAA